MAPPSRAIGEQLDKVEDSVRRSPGDAKGWEKLGVLYHANGFQDTAVQAYDKAIATSASDAARVHHLRAVALAESGNAAAAMDGFQSVLHLEPNYLPARILRAELLQKNGRAGEAMAEFRAVQQADPRFPEAVLALARDAMLRGEAQAALNSLEQLCHERSEYGSAFSLRAQLLDRLGRPKEAEAARKLRTTRKDPDLRDPYVEKMMESCLDVARLSIRFEDALNTGKGNEAHAILEQIERLEPNSWLLHRMRGFALAQSGEGEGAVAAYRRAAELEGEPASIYPGWVSALIKLGRTKEAEHTARAGLSKAPGLSVLNVMLGDLALKEGDVATAQRHFEEALQADDRQLSALRSLARLKWDQGQREAAADYARRVSALDPLDLPSRMLLGQAELEGGRPELAIEPLTAAFSIDRSNTELGRLLALAWCRAGNQLARAGSFAQAIEHYDRALAVDPNSVEARSNKARVMAFLHKTGAAESPVASGR